MITVLRLFLGLWLVTSALAKLGDWRGFRRGALEYELGPPAGARVVGWLLPWLELGTALLLLAGHWVRPAAVLVTVLIAVFSLAIAVNLRRGRRIPCYCHGTRHPQPIGAGALARNAWLAGCAIALWILATLPGPVADDSERALTTTPFTWAEPVPQGMLVIWLWLMGNLLEVAVGVLSRRPLRPS